MPSYALQVGWTAIPYSLNATLLELPPTHGHYLEVYNSRRCVLLLLYLGVTMYLVQVL